MIAIFFILGLIIGSFLNAVIYRLNAVESLWERSHCPHCRKKIRWYDNVPLMSFVFLSARCRDCGEKISWQYPVLELFTGVLFVLVGNYFFFLFDTTTWLPTLFYLTEFSLLLIIFVYDLKYMEIPMLVLWIAVTVALAYWLYADWKNFQLVSSYLDLHIVSGIIAAVVAFMFFFSLAAYSKETWMGYGDAYLGMLAGVLVGWPNILIALTLSFTIGALISAGLIFFRKKTMKSQVPFAPFLISGIFLVIMLPQIFPGLQFLFFLFG